MYELLGICLALAALLTFNAIASLLSALLWRALGSRCQLWPAVTRARLLFALRFIPAAAALCVLALLLPAYVAYEPKHNAEPVSLKLGLLAAISAAGLLLAAWRGLAAWRATRRLLKDWLRNADPIEMRDASIPVYRLRHRFPVIAVVGAFRPRLFITDYLLDSLSREELAAAIAHECGHLASRDNLKRALLRVCRDVLTILPCGRSLDRDWAEAAEAAADEYAARKGGPAALDLAAALVKIARLIPPGAKPIMPAGALLIGENAGGIAARVTRLMQMASAGSSVASRAPAITGALWFLFASSVMAVLLAAFQSNWLVVIHLLIEAAVSTLQ
ncbi:MAG: M48 family metalloprotease [Blastocatellia bacterium]